MKIGDRVRVKQSVVVYTHPDNKGQPFDVKDMEGEIKTLASEWQGKPISANFPYVVQFDKKFKAHFKEDELDIIELVKLSH